MSDRALIALEKDNQTLRSRLKKLSGKDKEAVKQGIFTASAMGSAFGVSYLEARYPDKAQVASVPVSLLAGGVASIVGAMGYAGENSDVIGMAGLGMLCAYGAKRGTESGNDAKAKAK